MNLEAESATEATDYSSEEIQSLHDLAHGTNVGKALSPRLETQFDRHARLSNTGARVALPLITSALYFLGPLWVPATLGSPQQTETLMLLIELAVLGPLFALVTLAQLRYPASKATEWGLLGAYLAQVFCIELIRRESARIGYVIDPSMALPIPVSVVVIVRPPPKLGLAFVAAYFAVIVSTSWLWRADLVARLPTTWLTEILLTGTAVLAAWWSTRSQRRQWASNLLLQLMAYRDHLTGLPNRRAFEEHYERQVSKPLASDDSARLLALLDLDHFKELNDHYGHDYGDGALAEIGLALAGVVREMNGMAARLGGDEFVILADGNTAELALQRLQAVVTVVRNLRIEHRGADTGFLTCSVGAVLVRLSEPLGGAYREADSALYRVKRNGRNNFDLARAAENLRPGMRA